MPTYSGCDGGPLHYDEIFGGASDGEAWPIVVLAGGAARHPSYLGDLAGLGDRHRLIVPHLRGVGRSPMPSDTELGSFWRQAEDVECLRVHLGLERMVLVGHSAGTRLAVSYAAQFRQRLAGMALITPPAGYLVDEPSDAADLIEKRHGDPVFATAVAAMKAAPDTDDDAVFSAWQQATAPAGYAAWGASEQAHARTGRWNTSRRFYETYFGFDAGPATRYDDGVLIIRNGDGFDLALGEGEVEDLGGFVHFGFRLPDPAAVRMLRERLMADSLMFVEDEDMDAYVGFKCLDPDGYVVEVYWEA